MYDVSVPLATVIYLDESVELQGSGWYVKLYSGINKTRNFNRCTPVCMFLK